MITSTRRVAALLAGAAILLAACGSDSDPELSDTTFADTSVDGDDDLFTQVEEGGEASEPDPAASTTIGDTAADSTPDTSAPSTETTVAPAADPDPRADEAAADGSDAGAGGTADDAQDSLDDAGVDVDLDDIADGLDDFNTGEGGGVVTVDGVAYEFAGDFCIASATDFLIEGPGTTADGLPFWGSISASSEFDFDGDGEPDETLDVLIEVGKDELFGSGSDDLPDLSASKLDSVAMQLGEDIEYTINGTTISGSGPIEDFNSVLVPLGETLPMTFEGNCS